uniref:PHD-type domain-containing protein n=1 Tax=Mesocestoides corti TaxID=53468 RepID=A0A5K3G0C3_MESCO
MRGFVKTFSMLPGKFEVYYTFFSAQREGLLAEPAYEENPSDPYFAQCRQHTDKQVAKARRRNYLTAVNRCRLLRQATEMEKKACASVDAMEDFGATGEVKSTFVLLDERLKRKLETFRTLYQIMLDKREVPYTRPTKAPLYLENSPVAMRLFMAKAVSLALPIELTGSSAVTEASKSTAPGCPVFCPDFISYVLDREKKLEELSKKLTSLESIQRELQLSDANVSHNYNCLSTRLAELNSNISSNRNTAKRLLGYLSSILSGVKASESLEALLSSSETAEGQGVVRTSESARSVSADDSQSRTVHGRQSQSASTQCSQKRTRKLPLSSGKRFRRSLNGTETIVIDDDLSPTDVTPTTTNSAAVSTTPPDNIFHQCNICNGYRDQHLLTICETCKKAFHIACLDPPLSRVPKRSKLFAWQCSMCTIAVVNPNDVVTVDVNAPRQLRRSSAFIPPHAVATSAAPTLVAPMVRRRVQKSSARRPRNRTRRSRAGARRRASRPIRVRAEAYPCQMDDDVIPAVAYPAISINPKADIDVNKVVADTVDVLAVSQELKHVDYEEEEDSEENTGNDSEDTCNSSGVAESETSDNRENDEENNDKEDDVVYANKRARSSVKSTVLKRTRSTTVDSSTDLCDKANSSDDELASLRGSKGKLFRLFQVSQMSFASTLL